MHTPRTAALVAIGDELTLGQKLDTNSAWLADRLTEAGIRTQEHRTVDDERARLASALAEASGWADVLITSGGLGPTADDLTRDALADVMGEDLVEDEGALRDLLAWFDGRGRRMPGANRVQAMRPASARMLANPHGTAPGLRASVGGCAVYCLPGPPREMRPMFESLVAPELVGAGGALIATRFLGTFGLGESEVARRLGALMDRARMPLVGTTASGGIVTCRVRCEGVASPGEAEAALDETERLIRERVGPAVFGVGSAPDLLERTIVDLLRDRGETVCVVESCTGGSVGRLITGVAGSSDVFAGGWITYSNAMKVSQVGVSVDTLDRFGAVSVEVAREMASGGRERAGAGWCLSITGVAGPGGGTDEKPVGTVWIGLARAGAVEARCFRFAGDRATVRDWSARAAVGLLRLRLAGEEMELLREVGRG